LADFLFSHVLEFIEEENLPPSSPDFSAVYFLQVVLKLCNIKNSIGKSFESLTIWNTFC